MGSFKEVVLGLNSRDAVENAKIYLERERALKGQPCPLGTDHMGVVRLVARGQMVPALELLLASNPLPEATGRLCPEIFEETLCQNRKGERVSLRAMERFLADHYKIKDPLPSAGKIRNSLPLVGRVREGGGSRAKVAVIGSGPAGLSAAWTLVKAGYGVTVFESAAYLGGTLSYGYGEFQFPSRTMQAIIERMRLAGVEFVTHFLFGRMASAQDLIEQGFAAVLVATGVGVCRAMGIVDENAGGVITADEFLKAINWRGEDPGLWLGRKVLVIGESGPAFACARIAIRVERDVTVVIRGPETHVKALPMFVRHAVEEGVKCKAFTKPAKIMVGNNGCVKALGCSYLDYRMDQKGRMVLTEDDSAEFTLEADTVINATGWDSNTLFLRDISGFEFNADGSLRTRSECAETMLAGVFAAGGVVEPEMSLTDAMLSGIRAAREIDEKIMP